MKILSICGSPRKGNSETIILELQKLFTQQNVDNKVILLREKDIERCHGCVEFCNHKGKCRLDDDMTEIMEKMSNADAFIFITPNYFQMPPGLFKDYIDRCSVFFTANKDGYFKGKKAAVICVGTDTPDMTNVCVDIISHNFCEILGLSVVYKKSYQTHSELEGNLKDVLENGINPTIGTDLKSIVDSML